MPNKSANNQVVPRWKVTFRSKLFAGLSGIGLLLLALLALTNQVIHEASLNLRETRTLFVNPLVKVNILQTHINRIRSIELELSRMTDLFAVTTQIEALRSETTLFARQLDEFLVELHKHNQVDSQRLNLYWQGYSDALRRIPMQAERMNMDQVVQISTYESAARFTNIARTLQRIAKSTEQRAAQTYENSIEDQRRLRQIFLATSMFGFALFVMYIFLFSRSLSRRLSTLTDAVTSISHGQAKRPIEVQGNDELADLANGFNAMQEQVLLREGALRTTRAELEQRVDSRTFELNQSNAMRWSETRCESFFSR